MKNILYINTIKNFCIIGIFYNKKIIKYTKLINKNHLSNILYILDKFIKKHKIDLYKINFITNIYNPVYSISEKIGLSISKGISIGLNIKNINISLFELINEKINEKLEISDYKLILIKKNTKNIIWSTYKINKKKYIIYNNNIISDNIYYIINFLKKSNGIWICNGINLKKEYNINFNNIKIIYTNFYSYNTLDVIKKSINKITY